MKFINKKNFKKQEIEFLSDGLKITKKTLVDFVEYEISFEHISNKKKVQSTIKDGMLFTGFSVFTLGVFFFLTFSMEAGTVFMSFGILLAIITFFRRVRTVTIPTFSDESIVLYFNQKNKDEIVDLANQIISASNAFLLKKYGKTDRALAIDPQINNLQFLRDRDIISEEQYENLKDQLLGREHKSSIGFR